MLIFYQKQGSAFLQIVQKPVLSVKSKYIKSKSPFKFEGAFINLTLDSLTIRSQIGELEKH